MNGNRVLFIGNSHTYFNDMPALFADFCEAGTGERPFVTMLSHPGKTWEWHLQEYKEIDVYKRQLMNRLLNTFFRRVELHTELVD